MAILYESLNHVKSWTHRVEAAWNVLSGSTEVMGHNLIGCQLAAFPYRKCQQSQICVASDMWESLTMKHFSQIYHNPIKLMRAMGIGIHWKLQRLDCHSSGCDLFKVPSYTSGIVDTGASWVMLAQFCSMHKKRPAKWLVLMFLDTSHAYT